jgi:PAS domain S-box-containing protein
MANSKKTFNGVSSTRGCTKVGPGVKRWSRADQRLRSDIEALKPPPTPDALGLLHELQVHQIELELQNEEMRSARIEVEQALHRYTELFDFAPIGYIAVRGDRAIDDINHAGAHLLGKTRSLVKGARIESLVAPAHHLTLRNLLLSAEVNAGRQSCEMELLRNGEEVFPAHVSATILARAQQQVLLAFEDISERKQREERLQRTERALREADRRKDEFLAVLSHELRNPLAPIRNSVFVLAHSEPGGDAARNAQIVIERQVTHLTRLIDDLLDVTRIARGKINLRCEHLDLGALLRRALDDQQNSFATLGVELDSSISAEPAWIHADSARMVQIVSNVLTNSLKFTPRGGRVIVSLQRQAQHYVLQISDTGVGIPPEVLERVFEPFAQAPQTLERARGGLGLGLAMVKGLVELHGGSVSIESHGLRMGTRVVLTLPICTTPAREEAADEAPASHRRHRVLVIEDNLDSCSMLQSVLTLHGHDVRTAYDGSRGLELAAEFAPEVVICDIGLPGMDGYAVARAFRADPVLQDTFMVALSGYARPEDLRRAREAGFDHHLAKPTSPERLDRLISEARREPQPSGLQYSAGASTGSLGAP